MTWYHQPIDDAKPGASRLCLPVIALNGSREKVESCRIPQSRRQGLGLPTSQTHQVVYCRSYRIFSGYHVKLIKLYRFDLELK